MAKGKSINKFLSVLLIFLIIVSLYVFNRLGVINLKQEITALSYKLPVLGPILKYKQDRQIYAFNQVLAELTKRRQSIDMKENRLNILNSKLNDKQRLLQVQADKLKRDRQKVDNLRSRFQKQLEQVKSYNDKIKGLADLYSSMQPKIAVKQLLYLDDFLIIDILNEMSARGTQQKQNVAYILSLFPAERASNIAKKMMLVSKSGQIKFEGGDSGQLTNK